jgi:3-oxoadipate enol-lactonase
MGAIPVHHVEDGPPDAPVLVFANSLGTTLRMWEPQVSALGDRFRIVRYDHRGHGSSPVPPGPYTIDDIGADLLALLARLDVGRVNLCGLSLGGMAAMWLAAEAPQRVRRLALMSTSAALGPPSYWAERAAAVAAGGMAAITESVLARWFTPHFARQQPTTIDEMRRMLATTPTRGYAACCAALEHLDLVDRLPSITAETLVIAGAGDPATPPHHAERITASIAGARLVVVDEAAHLLNIERPGAVSALLADFLGGGTGAVQ